MMLERSKNSDLHIDLDGYVPADITTAPHIERIWSLSIRQDSFDIEETNAALCYWGNKAERLVELTVQCTGQESPNLTLSSFDVITLDRLRLVTFSCVPLDWTTIRSPKLTHLDLEYIQRFKAIPPVQLIDTLRHMSRLENLKLSFNMLAQGPVTECLPVYLHRLTTLEINFATPHDVEYFLSHHPYLVYADFQWNANTQCNTPMPTTPPIMQAISFTVTKRDFQALHGVEIMDNLIIFEPWERTFPQILELDVILPWHDDIESNSSVTRQVVTGLAACPLSRLILLDL